MYNWQRKTPPGHCDKAAFFIGQLLKI